MSLTLGRIQSKDPAYYEGLDAPEVFETLHSFDTSNWAGKRTVRKITRNIMHGHYDETLIGLCQQLAKQYDSCKSVLRDAIIECGLKRLESRKFQGEERERLEQSMISIFSRMPAKRLAQVGVVREARDKLRAS